MPRPPVIERHWQQHSSTQTHSASTGSRSCYRRNFLVHRYSSTIHCTSTIITAVSKYRSNSILSILSLDQSFDGSRASGACSVRTYEQRAVLLCSHSLAASLMIVFYSMKLHTHSFSTYASETLP